jgi:hypothetical protein
MKVFRRERLPVIAHVAFAASFAVLLYFGIVGGQTYGPALLGVAGTWGTTIVVIEYPVSSKAYQQWVKRKAEREAGYLELLTLANGYARAWDISIDCAAAIENATSDLTAAEKRAGLKRNHGTVDAVNVAKKKLLTASQSFLSAREVSETKHEEYVRARASVEQLAPSAVRSALADFDKFLTKGTTARDNARLRFVKAVRADLHQRRWPDTHSLPRQPGTPLVSPSVSRASAVGCRGCRRGRRVGRRGRARSSGRRGAGGRCRARRRGPRWSAR